MSKIKQMPHVTVEQVLSLRDAAIKIEQERNELAAQVERLTSELSKETVRKEAAYANEERLARDNLEFGRRIFARFNEDECWIFQDDGHDYPESLVCPVVMSAGKLCELVEARSERDELAAQAENIEGMIDNAMIEMQNMHPPMRRTDCKRLILAAMRAKEKNQ